MGVSDTLDTLRAQFEGCALVAYADLSANMVLATSADQTMMQEHWDGLCEMAHDVLRGSDAPQLLLCLGRVPPENLARAIVANPSECNVFLTAPQAPDFALCAVGKANLAVDAFYAAAQPILNELVQDD